MTLADLWNLSLNAIEERAYHELQHVRARRAERKQQQRGGRRAPWHFSSQSLAAGSLWRISSRPTRGMLALIGYQYTVDDVIDADTPLPEGIRSRSEYVTQKTELIRDLADGRLDCTITPEDVLVVYAVRAIDRRMPQRPLSAELLPIWDNYAATAHAQLSGMTPTEYLLEKGRLAIGHFLGLCAVIMGGEKEVAYQLGTLLQDVIVGADLVMDARRDLAKGIISIPANEIARYRLDTEALRRADIPYEALTRFEEWQRYRKRRTIQEWETLESQLPTLERRALPRWRVRQATRIGLFSPYRKLTAQWGEELTRSE